ncbi:hypothetical protein PSACC_00738 [Paramicrosporidium saccamoebae]|uniref:Uncharacterized protein n=1 Tax=Paramicrosporidium saccamoebae TaxID=1246581 RepID=A0A2H9TP14_9FUNG|nr:hypothetical protein PSACC_00738 [Paramicrosporidium saccamoebae]
MFQNVELIVDSLLNEDGIAGRVTQVAFSPSGAYLASCSVHKAHLQVCVWDLVTGGIALCFNNVGITGRIVSFVWGHQLLVATSEFKLYSFDVTSGMLRSESVVDAPKDDVLVDIHPYNKIDSCLIVFRSGLVILFDVNAGTPNVIRAPTTDVNVTCSAFHESGVLYLGLSKDLLIVVNLHTRQDMLLEGGADFGTNCVVQRVAIHPMQKQISFVLKDKTIRVANLLHDNDTIRIEPRHKLQDAVNRWLWNICGFSHDGELIWGSFCTPGEHLIYMWDSNSGTLVKMLQGPKEDLILAAWNPKGPSIITGTSYGALYRWVPEYPVKWSALVPGLEEIEENTVEEELNMTRKSKSQDEESFINVISKDPTALVIENVKLVVNALKS